MITPLEKDEESIRCFNSGKVKIADKKAAQTLINRTKNNRGKEGAKRFYICEFCGYYHLTSKNLHSDTHGSFGDVKLKLKTEWEHLLKQQENETELDDGKTVQTDQRNEKRPQSGATGNPSSTCNDRFRAEVPSRQSDVAQAVQLRSTSRSRGRKKPKKTDG